MQHRVFLGLGSNVGDRAGHLRWAARQLVLQGDVHHVEPSPVYESEAHVIEGAGAQPAYLNAVLELQTNLSPEGLLAFTSELEKLRGRDRTREARWASRTLDIDILAFGAITVDSNRLQVPHPRIDQRLFVLVPWNDLAPEFWVPAPFDLTVGVLLDCCQDRSRLAKTSHILLD